MRAPLRPLHATSSLVPSKMELLRAVSTEDLVSSLRPSGPAPLVVKPNGLVINGNHRVAVLMERGVDVNALPRAELEDDDAS